MLFNFHVVLVFQFLCRVIGPAIAGKLFKIISKLRISSTSFDLLTEAFFSSAAL